MNQPKAGVLTSEFWMHILVVIAGTASFWEMLQHYLELAKPFIGSSGPAAALVPLAVAFLGFMLLVAQTAQKYAAGRVQLKAAPVTVAPVTTVPEAAEVLGNAGKTLAVILAIGMAGFPVAARAADDAPTADPDHAVVKSCVEDPDNVLLGHGVWLSDIQAIKEANELQALRAETNLHVYEVLGVIVLAAAGGFAAAWFIHR